MSPLRKSNLPPEKKKKIEHNLLNIFKDIYFNSPDILRAKDQSEMISDEIRRFILGFAESSQRNNNEVDLLLKAKEKGQELVENHELVFFDEKVDKTLTMRAFLIPGMKVDLTEENASEKVTEDDLQAVDHELCISFRFGEVNEFTKLGNLLDIRANLAKSFGNKPQIEEEVLSMIKVNEIFKNSLDEILDSACRVISK